MKKNQDKWVLISRCALNEATEAEQILLQQMLQEDPALQQQFDWLLQILKSESHTGVDETLIANKKSLDKIFSKAALQEGGIRRKPLIIKKVLWWSVAASLVLLISVYAGILLFKNDKKTHARFTAKKEGNKPAIRKPVFLPDGTKVWLNEGSTLELDNNFKGNTREVTLIGEGFFDVVKNRAKPFIVHVNNVNINVLGTAFNVKGYKEDKDIQTTLYRGLIKVSRKNDVHFQPILVYPNQKIVIPKTEVSTIASATAKADAITLLPIDSTQKEERRMETAWIYGRIDFKAETLFEVTNKMAYRYQVKFVFEDEGSKQLSFTGSFENETLVEAMKALKTANSFNYKIENNEVIISAIK